MSASHNDADAAFGSARVSLLQRRQQFAWVAGGFPAHRWLHGHEAARLALELDQARQRKVAPELPR